MIRRLMASPSPVPAFLVVKKGSKMRATRSSRMPDPVSAMANSITRPWRVSPGARLTERVPPSGMAWIALVIRLTTTCSRVRASAGAAGVDGSKVRCSLRLAWCNRGSQRPRIRSRNSARSKGNDLELQGVGEEQDVLHQLVQPGALIADAFQRTVLRMIGTQTRGHQLQAGADVVDGVAHLVGEDGRHLSQQRPLGQGLALVFDGLALRLVVEHDQHPGIGGPGHRDGPQVDRKRGAVPAMNR